MANPVAVGVGIIATTVFLGGIDAAKSVVDNSAWTGGATAGVILHGLPDLVDGFKAGSGAHVGKGGVFDSSNHNSIAKPPAKRQHRR